MSGVNRLAELRAQRKAQLAARQAKQAAADDDDGGDDEHVIDVDKPARKGRSKSRANGAAAKSPAGRAGKKAASKDADEHSEGEEMEERPRKKAAGKTSAVSPPARSASKAGKKLSKRASAAAAEEEEAAEEEDDAPAPLPAKNAEVSAYMKQYEPIKRSIERIKISFGQLEKLKHKNKVASSDTARKQVMTQVDNIMASSNKLATSVKQQLDAIKQSNSQAGDKGAKQQMKTNLYNTYIRRFHSVMTEYNSAANSFKGDLQKRTRREIRMVDPTLSDQQVEQIVDSGKAQEMVKQALMSDNVIDVVRTIEERHLDILKLEQQVLEIYELFKDLAVLVDLQQESLDVIEQHIMKTQAYTEKAEQDLHDAEDYQKKARSRQCCCIIVMLVILVVILGPTLGTKLLKS